MGNLEKDWKEHLNNSDILKYRPKQFEFYKRSYDFLKSNKDIQINKGGMGLGKTYAISYLINKFMDDFGHFFIATPISQIKKEWSSELNKINPEKYVTWLSKSSVCKKKDENPDFRLKNCNDDCKYRKDLELNGEYNATCLIELDKIEFPIDIEEHKKNSKYCLLPITRCGMQNRDIIIGDYFGFIFNNMYNKVTDRTTENSCLIIDEAHMIPQRVRGLLTDRLNINKTVDKILEEIECDYFNKGKKIVEKNRIKNTLEILEKIKDKLKKKANNYGEGRYSYLDFKKDWKKFSSDFTLDIENLKNILNEFSREEYDVKSWDINPDPYSAKLVKFLRNWQIKFNDYNYGQHFQYFNKKKEEIQLKIVCRNPSEFLSNKWANWKKVIMISGTIPNEEYFSDMIGIDNYEVIENELIDSFNIKENTLIYPEGNFKSGKRKKTYCKNKDKIKEILNKMSGKTLIYTQSRSYSYKLCEILSDLNPYNLSVKDNNKLSKIKDEFINENNAIAIKHITGKVEGQNYQDKDNNGLDNIIVYGYPFPRTNIHYQDKIKYFTKKFTKAGLDSRRSKKKAQKYVAFYPTSSTIHQACMRAKRSQEDQPIIILWGSRFSMGSPGYKYAPDDLKGHIVNNFQELTKEVEKRENEREKDR